MNEQHQSDGETRLAHILDVARDARVLPPRIPTSAARGRIRSSLGISVQQPVDQAAKDIKKHPH